MFEIKKPYLLYLGDSSEVLAIKTARGIAEWRPEYCIGEYANPGCEMTLGLPKLSPKAAKAQGAQTLIVGLANSGGKISSSWIPTLLEALESGLDIASGLHQKIGDVDILKTAAKKYGCNIHDVRHGMQNIPIGKGQKRRGKRILTVGTDCSVGKMYTALAVEREMRTQGFDVSFKATGQSGLFLADNGICIDAVVADFIAGAVEVISPEADENHWHIIEGQGSLFNPSFAGVSTGLLHGAQADYLIMCHEAGRETIKDIPNYKLPTLEACIEHNLYVGRLTNPNVKMVGISLNCRTLKKQDAEAHIKKIEDRFGLPCFDPILTGVTDFVKNL